MSKINEVTLATGPLELKRVREVEALPDDAVIYTDEHGAALVVHGMGKIYLRTFDGADREVDARGVLPAALIYHPHYRLGAQAISMAFRTFRESVEASQEAAVAEASRLMDDEDANTPQSQRLTKGEREALEAGVEGGMGIVLQAMEVYERGVARQIERT